MRKIAYKPENIHFDRQYMQAVCTRSNMAAVDVAPGAFWVM
jgi:hypothetical protein